MRVMEQPVPNYTHVLAQVIAQMLQLDRYCLIALVVAHIQEVGKSHGSCLKLMKTIAVHSKEKVLLTPRTFVG